MFKVSIPPLAADLQATLQHQIDTKTKPLGSLGKIETLALQIGSIQNTTQPVLKKPAIVVFAADHGVATEGVSAYPQEVTYQMVMNFLYGGAAINVFGRQHGIEIHIVDAGVNFDFSEEPCPIPAKIGKGTRNYLHTPAMTAEQCEQALKQGAKIVTELHESGCNVIGFGEMGIGNTSSAALLMSLFCPLPLEECVGRGTGMDDPALAKKQALLAQALANNPVDGTPLSILATFGGFEIAMMCGAFLQAAAHQMVILVDGFIATAALLAAFQWEPHVLDYCIFSHVSDERGHQKLLEHLKAHPILSLDMRLGEGTGAAMAYPVVQAAVQFLVEMASFESAGVSTHDA